MEEEKVTCFDDFVEKIKDTLIPEGYICIKMNTHLSYALINNNKEKEPLDITLSITVVNDLTVTIYKDVGKISVEIGLSKCKHLLSKENTINSTTHFSNLLAFLKNTYKEDELCEEEVCSNMNNINQLLGIIIEKGCLGDFAPLLEFVKAQPKLTLVKKQARKYSNKLTTVSFLWQMISPKLYETLKELFILPSVRRIQQLSSVFAENVEDLNQPYLEASWINKNIFLLPDRTDVDDGEIPKLIADFRHVEKLYATEEMMPLKVAHKLTMVSLKPNNIQRTSPVHAKRKHNLNKYLEAVSSPTDWQLKGISQLCSYIFENYDEITYCLLGKWTSDCIEGRFDWYHQLNCANFYIGVRQIMESEKKIRTLTAIRSGVFEELAFTEKTVPSATVEWTWLRDELADDPTDLDPKDMLPLIYTSGYIGRSISRKTKCESCKENLGDRFCDKENSGEHTKVIELHDRENLLQRFMACSSSSQHAVFEAAIMDKMTSFTPALVQHRCAQGHETAPLMVRSLFNCMCKNLIKRANKADCSSASSPTLRKIRKLQNESSK
ncbi:hypothetical protein HELRODRAFT_174251 [Helobdella robusta]|uniref:Uncharacterized protein n=1 Tax=Helobdella robusta TaxID=6412 RepID=T1F7W0_HELRO|nr:hypothetical protein HELRODRAFT_174251 [Helobdella robusta]ESO02827.1 hypothetical protein HELRODRAFT_174251 [Helobdella robusta]